MAAAVGKLRQHWACGGLSSGASTCTRLQKKPGQSSRCGPAATPAPQAGRLISPLAGPRLAACACCPILPPPLVSAARQECRGQCHGVAERPASCGRGLGPVMGGCTPRASRCRRRCIFSTNSLPDAPAACYCSGGRPHSCARGELFVQAARRPSGAGIVFYRVFEHCLDDRRSASHPPVPPSFFPQVAPKAERSSWCRPLSLLHRRCRISGSTSSHGCHHRRCPGRLRPGGLGHHQRQGPHRHGGC